MSSESDPKDDREGWESFAEEAEGGSLGPNPELEEALREATESIEARQAERAAQKEAGGAQAPPAILAILENRVAELEGEQEALNERYLRLQADYDNHRKRTLKERQDALQYGHENLVKDLLATVDNLERAIEHASQSDGGDLQGMLQGVELVQRELMGTLDKHGVSEIAAEGTFDPNVHEAMAQVEVEDQPAGSVRPGASEGISATGSPAATRACDRLEGTGGREAGGAGRTGSRVAGPGGCPGGGA